MTLLPLSRTATGKLVNTCQRCEDAPAIDRYTNPEIDLWHRAMFRYPVDLCEPCMQQLKGVVDAWWQAGRPL